MNTKQIIIDVFELIIAGLASIPMLPILILFSIIGLGIGIFIVIKPALAIEAQRRFYEKINWKIEPISMQKEIRNTQIMGWILIVFSVITLVFSLTNKPFLS